MRSETMPRQRAMENRWTQKLLEQARDWSSAKADGRYRTDQGVPVVRRHKRNSPTKKSAA